MHKITISLPDDVYEILIVSTKARERSKFIAVAIKEKIKLEKKKAAFEKILGLTPINSEQNSVKTLSEIRQERTGKLIQRHKK
jgi:metal-responsive CopG/Arc/MetJ family transcriptional regulator